jgi:hypothetical protein
MLTQASRLHIHLDHDDPVGAPAHSLNIHAASLMHAFEMIDHHDNHPSAIEISSDNLIKKSSLLDSLVLVLIAIGIFLFLPPIVSIYRVRIYKLLIPSSHYAFQPPLRAPPIT